MGLIRFKPSRRADGAFEIQDMLPEASATIVVGAPLQRDTTNTNEVEEHAGGSTVTGIIGVAGAPVTSGTPEYRSEITVYKTNLDTDFVGQISSSGSVVTIPTTPGTYDGNSYGMIEVSGEWFIDADDTSDVVLTVIKEMPEINAVLFKWISTAISP